jgi:hypothetical protein
MQMVASIRRLEYTDIIRKRNISPERANPLSPMFDPERAAILFAQEGKFDEAIWIIFLATHFGKALDSGWTRLRDVYSGLRQEIWTWQKVTADIGAFRTWLGANEHRIRGKFGNHRRYQSIKAASQRGTAAVVESYISWVGPSRSHATKFGELIREAGNDPQTIFDHFYNDMQVSQFGRLGKFDFLALLGRLEFAPISPGSAYLDDATGPLRGARLLVTGDAKSKTDAKKLDELLKQLDEKLTVGMQVMEDSLCNWQKSPTEFVHFLG